MADEFQGMLAGPEANTLSITGNVELFDRSLSSIGDTDVDAADGLGLVRAGVTATWTCEVPVMPIRIT